MRWDFGARMCLALEPSAADLMQDILQSTYDALRAGIISMTPSELTDFNLICEQMEMTEIPPITPAILPSTRRFR